MASAGPAPTVLSRADARRVAVGAQLLGADRPGDLVDLVRHLTLLQDDRTAAVAPSAELVAWSRLGPGFEAGELRDAVDAQQLVDLRGLIRPAEDVALFLDDMRHWNERNEAAGGWRRANVAWVEANTGCRLDVLDALRGDGPLPAAELPDTCVKPWRSTGWNNNRNLPLLLELMVNRGEVAASGRDDHGVRLWDLAERVYPDVEAVPSADAKRIRDERRLRALGIARAKATETSIEPNDAGEAGVLVQVDGVRGTWRADPEALERALPPRTALLSPLDRLVYDRKRMVELFEFDYALEMYKPVAERRWGYWALPVLHGDRLVGKVDATADRKAGVLRVDAIHDDIGFPKKLGREVDAELASLASWLGLPIVRP